MPELQKYTTVIRCKCKPNWPCVLPVAIATQRREWALGHNAASRPSFNNHNAWNVSTGSRGADGNCGNNKECYLRSTFYSSPRSPSPLPRSSMSVLRMCFNK